MMPLNSWCFCGSCGDKLACPGNWHAHFGGRWREYETTPLFIRMPVDMGDEVNFEQLLAEWANEGNGQCLGSDVEHIVFHTGRYSLCSQTKAWVKHHHLLYTPSSTFKCPQRTQTGHSGHSTFVLRGIIAHQGQGASAASVGTLRDPACGRRGGLGGR